MQEAARTLIRFGRDAERARLLDSTCGNASVRVDDRRVLITASGAEIGHLSEGDLALVDLETGAHLDGPRPSTETPLHRRAYVARPAAGAVLHCQSRAATLLACHADPPPSLDLVPEIPAYVRRHAVVPWNMPGSDALADSVGEAFGDPEVTVVQMGNHGQVILGATPDHVIRRATFFELAAWMVVQGAPLRFIPEEDAAHLRTLSRDA
ncbi:MAG: class II aldolase/adducin family protein [Myxococcota bacterium]